LSGEARCAKQLPVSRSAYRRELDVRQRAVEVELFERFADFEGGGGEGWARLFHPQRKPRSFETQQMTAEEHGAP
jgi:hypothetical protein